MATLLLLLVNAFFIPVMPGALGEMFQISPANATGLNGADLTLSCHANSAPADVRWTKDGVYVQASTSITISHNARDSSILFSPVGYPREGVYRCVALDVEGTELFSSFPGEVNVLGQPSIITPPESQSVVVGGAAQFSCGVAGDPAPSVSWQFAHLPLPSSSKYSIQTDPHRLTVTDVRPTDAGYYDCNATNLYGSSFVSARLSIAQVAGDRPVVMVSPGDSITALEGTSQSITCYTSTTPTPAVYWTRNNMAITESSELSVTHLAGNSTLTFRALSPSHDGMYQCFANNTHGSDSVTVLLSVLVVPVVTRQPVNITVRAGEVPGTTVQCEASGNPQPAISILDSDGRIVSPAGVWVVPSLAREQGGAYSCVASSLAGTDSSSFIVSVEGGSCHAQLTISPSTLSACVGSTITLTCHHPELANNADTSRYIVSAPSWSEDGALISFNAMYQAALSGDSMSSTLTITITLEGRSAGASSPYYDCFLVLAGGGFDRSGNASVEILDHCAPILTPSSSTACPGDEVNLVCHHPLLASNSQTRRYLSSRPEWRENGITIPLGTPGSRYQATTAVDFTSTTLTFTISADYFSGRSFYYNCFLILTGGEGETSGNAIVEAIIRPVAPILSVAAADQSITFAWSIPETCFQSEIYTLIVIWNENGKGNLNTISALVSPVTIPNLTANTSYQLMVQGLGMSGVVTDRRVVTVTTDEAESRGLPDSSAFSTAAIAGIVVSAVVCASMVGLGTGAVLVGLVLRRKGTRKNSETDSPSMKCQAKPPDPSHANMADSRDGPPLTENPSYVTVGVATRDSKLIYMNL